MNRIFVYGTLKRGQVRAGALKDQEFLGSATTLPDYVMCDLGDYPGLVSAPVGTGDSIVGEVYFVDSDCRKLLDEIEAVDSGLYKLAEVKLRFLKHESFDPALQVWTYFYLGDVTGCRRLLCW